MSQTIRDESVVKLTFDGEQFEQATAQTMETVAKLKASLQFDDSVKKSFANIDSAASKINLSTLGKDVSSLKDGFSALGTIGMTVTSELTKSAMKLASSLIHNPVFSKIKTGGLARAENIEKARFQLQGLISDQATVEQIMTDAQESVTDTAYSYDSAAKAASQFAATGIKAGSQMQMALKGIAGVAATTSSDYEGISHIFTTVAGNGRLMTDQLNQLAVRGLNASAALAKYFNGVNKGSINASDSVKSTINTLTKGMSVTEADIREFVSKSKISFDVFAEAMGESFGKHAKDANDTVRGVLDNVGAALSRTGAIFVSPMIEQKGELVQFLNSIRVKINEFNKAIDPVAKAVTDRLKELLVVAKNFVDNLDLSPLEATTRWVNNLLGGTKILTEKDFQNMNLTEKQMSLFERVLTDVARKHGIAIDDMIKKDGSFMATLKHNWLTKDIFSEALDFFTKKEETANQKLKSVAEVRKAALATIRGDYGNGQARVDALKKAGFDPKTVQDYVNKLHELTGGTWKYNEAMLNTVDAQIGSSKAMAKMSDKQLESLGYTKEEIVAFKTMAAAVKVSGASFDTLSTNINSPRNALALLRGTITNIFDSIKSITGAIKNAFSIVFPPSSTSLVINITKALFDFSRKLKITDSATNKIQRTFVGLFTIFKGVKDLLSNLVGRILSDTVDAIVFVGEKILTLTAFIGDLISKGAEFKNSEQISGVLGTIAEKIQSVFKFFSHGASEIKAFIDSENLLVRASKLVAGAFGTVANFFKIIIGKVRDFLSKNDTLVASLKDLGTIILGKLSNAFDNFLSFVASDNIQNGVNSITNFAEVIGSTLVKALETGGDKLKNFVDLIKDASFKDITLNVKANFNGFLEWIKERIFSFIPKIRDYIDSFKKHLNLKGLMSAVGDGMKFELDPEIVSGLEQLKTKLEKIPFDKIISMIVGFMTFWASTKILGLIGSVTNIFKKVTETIDAFKGIALSISGLFGENGAIVNVINNFGGIFKSISDAIKTEVKIKKSRNNISNMVKIVEMIAVVAVLIVGLGYLYKHDKDVLRDGGTLVVAIGLFLIAVNALIGLTSPIGSSGGGIANAAKGLLMMSSSLFIVIAALKTMESLDTHALWRNMLPLGLIVAGMLGIMYVLKKIDPKDTSLKALGALVLFAISLKILVSAFADLDALDLKHPYRTLALLVGLAIGLALVSEMTNTTETLKGTIGLVLVVAALWMLVGVIKKLADVNVDTLKVGLTRFIKMFVVLILLMLATKAAGKYAMQAGVAVLAVALAMNLFIVAIKAFSRMATKNPEGLKAGLEAMGEVMLMVALLFIASIASGKYAARAGVAILAVGAAILMLSAAMLIMSAIKPEKLEAATGCISLLIGMFALLVASTKFAGGAVKSIIAVTVAITLLTMMMIALSYVEEANPGSLLKVSVSLSLVMISLAAVLYTTSKLGKDAWAAVAGITVMIVAIGLVGLALYALQKIGDPDKYLPIAESLSLLLLAMTAVIWVLAKSKIGPGEAAKAALAIDAFAGIVGGLIAIVTGLLTGLNEKLGDNKVFDFIDNMAVGAEKLGNLFGSFFRGFLGKNAVSDSDQEEASLTIQNATDVLDRMAPLAEKAADVDLVGVDRLSQIVSMMKDLTISGLATAFKGDISTTLGRFADNMDKLGIGLSNFIASMPALTDYDLLKLGYACAGIQRIAKIEVPTSSGIFSWFTGKFSSNIQSFGANISWLAIGLGKFIENMPTVSDYDLQKIGYACAGLQRIASVDVPASSGLFSLFSGNAAFNMEYFGADAHNLAIGLGKFIENMPNLNDYNLQKIGFACAAIQRIADVNVGTSSGIFSLFTGSEGSNMTSFGNNAGKLSEGLNNFINGLPSESGYEVKIDEACVALQKISDLTLSEFFATSTEAKMINFGSAIGSLATGFTEFLSNLTIPGDASTKLQSTNELVATLNYMTGSSTFIEIVDPFTKSLSKLGTSINDFGMDLVIVDEKKLISVSTFLENLKKAFDGMNGFDPSVADNIALALDKLYEMSVDEIILKLKGGSDLLDSAVEDFTDSLTEAFRNIPDVSGDIGKLVQNIGTQILNHADAFTLIGKKIAGMISGGMSSNLGSSAADTSKSVSDAMTSSMSAVTSSYKQFSEAGKNTMVELSGGIKVSSVLVITAIRAVMAASVVAVRTYYSQYNLAGKYLVIGFANGINQNRYMAEAKARAMANAAKEAAKKALGEHSPSKEFYAIGDYAVQGFANALVDGTKTAYISSYEMASSATSGLNKALTNLSNIVDSNMDTQPTIRPVMDLTEIQNGMNTMDGMLAFDPMIGVGGNLGAVSNMMMFRPRSATNDDVITAINGLQKTLGSQGDNIVINGITYDDGSNITDAVKALVRAAKMERRA